MIVVCKKDTKRMVKGIRYDVDSIYVTHGGKYKVSIKDIGAFSIDNFTDINGNSLPNQPFNNVLSKKEDRLIFENLSKGDILVCTTDHYKNLIKGKMYKIEDLKTISREMKGWNGKISTYVSNSIKFEGSNRFLKFNMFGFRSLRSEESRELSLSSILDGTETSFTIDKNLRKIDAVLNKDCELIKILSKSIVDSNRHHLDVIDWACKKSAANMGINRLDYEKFLDMPLKQILEIVKQNK